MLFRSVRVGIFEEPDEPDELEPDELLEEVSEGVLLDLPCESK